ncbi:ABC transporter ATP-binding protein [Nonomuraea fuscirosea]
MDAAVTFSGVGKRFDDGTQALQNIDLTVAPGQFVTVVGPSGCGKSTLLRLAAGLGHATEGVVQRGPAAGGQVSVGYVFQDPTLLPWRTVRSNVELFAELQKLPRLERRRHAEEALALVGMTDTAGRRPYTLSGGMQMRVSLARALASRPDLLLLDEPFGALDEITRERLNDELLRLFALRGFAALFVTHSVSEAVFLATRVVVLSDRPGRIVATFEVPFVYPRPPELRFAAQFSHIAAQVSACLRGTTG